MIWIWISAIIISLGNSKIIILKMKFKRIIFFTVVFILVVFFFALKKPNIYDTKNLIGQKLNRSK